MQMSENKLFQKIQLWVKELKYKLSALYLAYKRKDVPVPAKIIAVITVAYALSPIDLIPDFIPVLGYLYDLIILPLLICLALKLIPGEVMAECKEQARDLWKDGKPKKWRYAIPIIVIYILIIAVIIVNVIYPAVFNATQPSAPVL
jgi:uncharacterized membrane protein YkvA (DUF1232 family)